MPALGGYVIQGQVRVTYADNEEILRTGDLFYLPPGHTAYVDEMPNLSSSARPVSTSQSWTLSVATRLPCRRPNRSHIRLGRQTGMKPGLPPHRKHAGLE